MENHSKSWLFGREKNEKVFAEICEAIFGYAWQSELSRRIISEQTGLNLNLRTIQRWASGRYPVPETVWQKLPALAREVSAEIGGVADDLDSFLAANAGKPQICHDPRWVSKNGS